MGVELRTHWSLSERTTVAVTGTAFLLGHHVSTEVCDFGAVRFRRVQAEFLFALFQCKECGQSVSVVLATRRVLRGAVEKTTKLFRLF